MLIDLTEVWSVFTGDIGIERGVTASGSAWKTKHGGHSGIDA